MPDNAPGVYVEEKEVGAKPIEGVSTSVAGFLGQTERGFIKPRLVTSFEEYQRIYGGYLDYSYLTYAIEGFFSNGGNRCYLARVVGSEDSEEASLFLNENIKVKAKNPRNKIFITISGDDPEKFTLTILSDVEPHYEQIPDIPLLKTDIEKKINGDGGSKIVSVTVISEKNSTLSRPKNREMARLMLSGGKAMVAQYPETGGTGTLTISAISPGIWGNEIKIKLEKGILGTVDKPLYKLIVAYGDDKNVVEIFDNFSFDQESSESYMRRVNGISNYVNLEYDSPRRQGASGPSVIGMFKPLTGGNENKTDGGVPAVTLKDYQDQLTALKGIDGISIICAPDEVKLESLTGYIIDHCDKLKDRFAVVSTNEGLPPDTAAKPNKDSKYAAIYYPWITVMDPLSKSPKLIPPCGHVAGVYARVDAERGVHKAPANEILRGAIGLERSISAEHQSTLNPMGINCIRSFPGRGIRIWGARTISSDPSWKYVNVRRLFIYLEKSIEVAIQWAVFEPNDEKLWARVKQTITQFLTRVWRDGALMGSTQDEAFFVRCDRTTMTQDDIDNGKLIVWIGVAPVKPAEFVVFRIAQVAKGSEIIE